MSLLTFSVLKTFPLDTGMKVSSETGLFFLSLEQNCYIPDITSQVHCASGKTKMKQAIVQ